MSGKAKEVPVKVGGRLRHLRVDNNALCIVEELTGADMVKGVANPGLLILRALCYGALVSGARASGEKRDFTVEDVGDWMEETPEILEVVLALMKGAVPEAPPAGPPAAQGEEAPRLTA